jgi:hypothetical protein
VRRGPLGKMIDFDSNQIIQLKISFELNYFGLGCVWDL